MKDGTFSDSHARLMNRIKRYPPQVVFLHGGTLRTVQATKDISKIVESPTMKLLGVYDERCEEDWLYSDLLWAEKHWGHYAFKATT